MTGALDSDYENGVADVLSFLAGEAAVVERNVHMPGRLSKASRQIDIKVSGLLFGLDSATMVVDCKRYGDPLDVNDIGTFVSLVEDVGADFGRIITTKGISEAGRRYAEHVRGIRFDVLTLDELAAWSPRGTVRFEYEVDAAFYPEAVRALRRAGFRVTPGTAETRSADARRLRAFRHLGVLRPSGEQQGAVRDCLEAALRDAGVPGAVPISNGVVVGGGTPTHRWLEVTDDEHPIGLKVLASSEEDIARELARLVPVLEGVPANELDVRRPDVWPVVTMFPSW